MYMYMFTLHLHVHGTDMSLSREYSLQTIDFELRKLDAQQAAENINLLKSFMPNTFLVSGGRLSHDHQMTYKRHNQDFHLPEEVGRR